MRRGLRRLTAVFAAALLCLSCPGCTIGGIRIEQIENPPVNEPPETKPPETKLPETEVPETRPPETEAPETAVPVTDPPEPDPAPADPEPSIWVKYAEEDFRERRGNGWLVKALTMNMWWDIFPMGNGRFFAFWPHDDNAAVTCAVVDLPAMAVAEAEIALDEPERSLYTSAWGFCLQGDPYLILTNQHRVLRLDPDRLTVTGSASWTDSGAFQTGALPLEDGRAVMTKSHNGRLLFFSPAEPEEGGIVLSETEVALPEGFSGFTVNCATSDGLLLVSFDNGSYELSDVYQWQAGFIDSRTGETTLFDSQSTDLMQTVGNYIIEEVFSAGSWIVRMHRPGMEMGEISITPPEDSWLAFPGWNVGGHSLFFEHRDETGAVVTAVDAASLKTLGRFTLTVDQSREQHGALYDAGDYLISAIFELDTTTKRLVYWDWADIEPPGTVGAYPTLDRSEEAELRREITRIYDETGLSVYVGNDAVRYLDGYAVQTETNVRKQLEAVRSLTAFFDNCPPGYIRELTEKSSAIDICLTGKIIPEPGNRDSISDASAFVTTMNDCQVMVLDILQGGLTETVAHEFLHIAENAMWNIWNAWWEEHPDWSWEQQNPTDVFWYWSALNPPDFEYAMVYTDENGVTLGSDDPRVWNWEAPADINTIYFVDGYSTTYPTEDRARIFQSLATCEPDALPEAFRSEAIRKKAAYLCACLRRSFRSLAEAENVFWEQSLNPEWNYEYFETNYEIVAEG